MLIKWINIWESWLIRRLINQTDWTETPESFHTPHSFRSKRISIAYLQLCEPNFRSFLETDVRSFGLFTISILWLIIKIPRDLILFRLFLISLILTLFNFFQMTIIIFWRRLWIINHTIWIMYINMLYRFTGLMNWSMMAKLRLAVSASVSILSVMAVLGFLCA